MQMSMFSLEEHRANRSAWLAFARDLMTREATSCSPSLQSLESIAPDGSFGKTSPAFCPVTKAGILEPSSPRWGNAGMGGPIASWTLSMSEHPDFREQSHSDDAVSSLLDILEIGDVPPRFFLSAKACRGILRRAEKRGKSLPPFLHAALEAVASEQTSTVTVE